MKVNVNFEKEIPLTNIKIGDCFTYDAIIYMRILDRTNIGTNIGTVNLKTGEVIWWDSNMPVRPIACEVNERKD